MITIDLFRIVSGSDVWTLTSADQEQSYNAGSGTEIYDPVAVQRSEVVQKNEISKASLTLDIPIDHELAVIILTSYTEQIITMSVFTNRDGTVSTSWKGRLSSYQPSDSYMTLTFESIFTSLRRPGLRATFQKNCRHALYGRGCTLVPSSFEVVATLNDITDNTLTVPEAALQADGYYLSGMVAAPDGAYSYIISHVGDQLVLQRMGSSLASAFAASGPGLAISIFPGCNHSRTTCNSKFSNLLNYGGFDWIPDNNPMGGSSIV